VIGNNGSAGIRLDGVGGITVESNYVGTDATDADHGNAGPGVDVADLGFGPPSWIGADVGTAPAGVVSGGNVIAYNEHGIVIELAESVSTRGNRLFANGGIGIDLADDGVTNNDLGDLDLGSNRLQNKPVFDRDQTAFVVATGDLDVRYRVDASPGAVAYPLTIDFYIHDPWLEPGDQARVYIGSDTYVAAEAGAFRTTTITPLAGTLAPNVHGFVFEGLRATATDANGNTSELTMEPVPVPEPGLAGALAAGLIGLVGLGKVSSRR
jgi:titin